MRHTGKNPGLATPVDHSYWRHNHNGYPPYFRRQPVLLTGATSWRRNLSEEWQLTEKTVHLTHTSCAYGGSRIWFICPYCSRRVAVVILDAGHVACRHCLNLTYASCNEDLIDRSWRKRDKYKARMGGNDKGLNLKPKGMHQRTWLRLRHQYFEAEMQGWEWAEARLEGDTQELLI
ncbi:MAG: hypothetical protein PHD01_11570, partial [Geobacteraceae bacterium]|nr:hypothetical protein [Geobacteraceae bacterium]